MSSSQSVYYTRVQELIAQAWKVNEPVIARLAPLLGAVVARGDVIHMFGSGHSDLIAREVIGRAGSLACMTGIIDPTDSFIENLPGYGMALAERYDRQYEFRSGEAIIVVSYSGKNSSPIEVALHARERGLTVVALTCMTMSRVVSSGHASGRRLFEVADHVLDTSGILGDASVEIDSTIMAGPTSTLVGCSVLNWLVLATIDWLKEEGHPLPLLRSQNLPGAIEHNRRLGQRYRSRLSRSLA